MISSEQKEFIRLTRQAVAEASPIAFPQLCAFRDDELEEAAELVLRFALHNGITPQEAMAHVESFLSEE